MQVLAAAVFLLHSCDRTISDHRTAPSETEHTARMIQNLLEVMTIVSEQPYGECAKEDAVAIRSLIALLDGDTSSTSAGLTMSIPLLGKLHVRRRTNGNPRPVERVDFTTLSKQLASYSANDTTTSGPPMATDDPSASGFPDPASWWVEIPTEFPFLSDELSGIDQWSSFSILDGM